MFTGIIEALGRIEKVVRQTHDLSLVINVGDLSLDDVKLGDSIAVNGVCLTVVKLQQNAFEADVSIESLANTNIGNFKVGTQVNLEKALTLSTRMGGHMVSGHVDGVGRVARIAKDGRSTRYEIDAPADLHKYIAAKGSITVDGVSLTVTVLRPEGFCLNIVPHTSGNTIIPEYSVGTALHIEVDVIARYTERLLSFDRESGTQAPTSALDKDFLFAHGFTGRQ